MESTSSAPTTTGPATFAEAFAADASSASTPDHSQGTADQSAGTTAQPATPTTDGTTPVTGEPPKERWADILENARTKARDENEAQWAQHAWAKQVSQAEFQQIAQMAQKASSDPIAYLQDFIKDLQSHPTYGAQLKSLAAKALSQRSAAPQNVEPQLESVPVQLEDGRVVQFVTADSQAKREAWLQQQMLAQAEQKFAPFTKTVEDLQAEKAALAKEQEVSQYVEATRTDVLTWPGMADEKNRVAVAEELKRIAVNGDDPREVSLALNAAYRKVVLPALAAKSESTVLETLQRKAAASTSVNPGSAASSAPSKVSSFYDKSLQWR